MRVRILKETPYQPQAGDSQRLIGQLRVCHPHREIRFSPEKGVEETILPGPRCYVFPVGACPEVPDELGNKLIAQQVAEIVDGPKVCELNHAEIISLDIEAVA